MLIDKANIVIKAGNGGDGRVSFYTAKYIPNGGPNGGDGGKGGDIVFVADSGMNTLLDYKYNRFFRAENGERGDVNNRSGKSGKDLIIRVPCGTIIKEKSTGKIIADMYYHGQRQTVCRGGRGGLGNSHFANPRRQAPNFAQKGEITKEYEVTLELKLIADVGIIGYPNAGKSTLLSVISDAKPKIADYHFTTLSPILGVVRAGEDSFVAADIPGLIEGASEGVGLGHQFLRHIERTRLLVHLVDISESEGRSAVDDYYMINSELEKYLPALKDLPQIVVLSKADLLQDSGKVDEFKKAIGLEDVMVISSITNKGVKELINKIAHKLRDLPKPEPFITEAQEILDLEENTFYIDKVGSDYFVLSGKMVENIARNVNLDDPESVLYFQKALDASGINKALREKGIKDGDTVKVLEMEFEYYE